MQEKQAILFWLTFGVPGFCVQEAEPVDIRKLCEGMWPLLCPLTSATTSVPPSSPRVVWKGIMAKTEHALKSLPVYGLKIPRS